MVSTNIINASKVTMGLLRNDHDYWEYSDVVMWPPHGISPVPQYRKVSNSPFFPVSYISVPCILHSQCRDYKNHIVKVGSGWYYQHGEVMGAEGGVKNFLALFISLLLFWCFNKSIEKEFPENTLPWLRS